MAQVEKKCPGGADGKVLVILTIYYHPYNSYHLVEKITTIALTYSDFFLLQNEDIYLNPRFTIAPLSITLYHQLLRSDILQSVHSVFGPFITSSFMQNLHYDK